MYNDIHIIIFTFNNLYYTKKRSKTELVIILNIDNNNNMHECVDNPNIGRNRRQVLINWRTGH